MSNEKQQTAVDIAFEKLANSGLLITRDYKNLVAYHNAKEMEKEKLKDAWKDGRPYQGNVEDRDAEQWYNETYGGKK